MSHFAEVIAKKVTRVIVAELDFINMLPNPGQWIQTSYNTHGGVHLLGGTPLRKNFAGIGYTYDPEVRDAFVPPQPFGSWTLSEDTCLWSPPTPYPEDGKMYLWFEPTGWEPVPQL